MKTWMKWAIAAVVVAVLALVAGPFIYINFIKDDAPDRFALDDTTAGTDASSATSPPTTGPAATVSVDPAVTATPAPAPAATAAPAAAGGADGTWVVAAGSAVGYRVVEVLFGQDTEGVGRTDQVTGQFTVAGSHVSDATFEVDMTTLASDESRRDNQFNGRLMDTATFPTATFALTAPIELGSAPADGAPVTATATGDLTLRGVTRPVTLEVQAQKDGEGIQIVGSTDIVFADYSIPQPDIGGITTQDHGLLEFDLQLSRG